MKRTQVLYSVVLFWAVIGLVATSVEAGQVIKLGMNPAISLPFGQAGIRLGEIVKQKTQGRIEIQVFASGSIGNEQELLQGMSLGTTDMSMVIGGTYANVLPDFSVLGMTYAFRDVNHMQKAMRGEIGKYLSDKMLKERNIRILDISWLFGIRHLTTNKPILRPDDLKGLKIRVVPAQVYQTSWTVLGAVPTPVEWGDIYVALKTGMVDGQENPFSNIKAAAIQQVNKYLDLTGHTVANVVVAMSDKLYKSLTPEDRAIIESAVAEAGMYNQQLAEKDASDTLEWLKHNGMTVVQPDIAAFQQKAATIPQVFENGKWLELYKRIQAIQ